jgi:outer membrane protein OmpA-like peptidoglycan-associated protein
MRAALTAIGLAIRDRLLERPDVRVEIAAHTDPAWVCEHCGRRLTQDRADSVRRFLIEHGIAPERLEARGYGGARPLRVCRGRGRAARACRLENLRIELRARP